MLGIERRREIMKLLNQHQKVYVQDLSKLFDVTDETIRRDLEKLEQQNLVKRCYGGAVINDHTSQDISFLRFCLMALGMSHYPKRIRQVLKQFVSIQKINRQETYLITSFTHNMLDISYK